VCSSDLFPVAAALARGRVGVKEVTGESLRDPVIARLVAATRVREDETYNARFPEGRWGEVTVVLSDGRRVDSGPKNARGGPDDPLAADEILDKFRDFATPVLGQARTREIESAVLGLWEPDADFARTLDLITAP
jgi:2-methylcitrate dehydratase PrpD